MGSDLFGSFGEASCAALLIGVSCESIEAAGITYADVCWRMLTYVLIGVSCESIEAAGT
jgi:hypothetical protein